MKSEIFIKILISLKGKTFVSTRHRNIECTSDFLQQQVRLKQAIYLASWEYLAENVQLEDLIAKCGGGEVRKGKLLSKDHPPMTVAIKTVTNNLFLPHFRVVNLILQIAGRSLEAKEKVQELMRECRLLRELNHPCITQNYGVCLISQPHCFVLEYVEGKWSWILEDFGDLGQQRVVLRACISRASDTKKLPQESVDEFSWSVAVAKGAILIWC